jgi:uncharacterized protein (TIGR02588 family)
MARKPAPKSKTIHHHMPVLERGVAAVGAVIILCALGVLARDALQPHSPPALTARLVAVRPVPAGFRAEVEVVNSGRAAAAAVDLEGVLTPPSGPPETATASLDYVPGDAGETAMLQFRGDPRAGALELTVRGWSEP